MLVCKLHLLFCAKTLFIHNFTLRYIFELILF